MCFEQCFGEVVGVEDEDVYYFFEVFNGWFVVQGVQQFDVFGWYWCEQVYVVGFFVYQYQFSYLFWLVQGEGYCVMVVY